MKTITKFAAGAAALLAVGLAAAPASAQPYGHYAPRSLVCDPYSRYYDPFYCTRPYYGSAWGFGGPTLSFNFGSGFHDGWRGNNWRGNDHGGNWNRGGNNNTNHGGTGGHRH